MCLLIVTVSLMADFSNLFSTETANANAAVEAAGQARRNAGKRRQDGGLPPVA
jgi:hypothetical protein